MKNGKSPSGAAGAQKKRLPAWAKLAIACVVAALAGAGLIYYWRVVYTLPWNAVQTLLASLAAASLLCLLVLAAALVARIGRRRRAASGDPNEGERTRKSSVQAGAALLPQVQADAKNAALRGALVAFVLGLLFCFASAPLQAPDEREHYLRAYAISMGDFNYAYEQAYPADVSLLLEHFDGTLAHRVRYQNAQLAGASVEQYWQDVETGAVPEAQAPAAIMFMLVPFLPQGLAMAVARLLGFGALGLMYAGRIANLAIYCLLCYATFKNAAAYRGVFYAFALLPLSLFMAASCSYDSIMLALCFYMLSYFCKPQVTTRDLVLFGLALLLANYIKPLNFVLAAVLLLVPKRRWKSKLHPWLVVGLAAVAAVVLAGAFARFDSGVLKTGDWPELPRGSGDAADTDGQLAFVLRNPLRFVAVALLSLLEADGFLFDLGRLGGMDLVLPMVGGLSVLVLVAAAVLAVRQREDNRTGALVALPVMALLYAGAVLAGMYITDSDVASIRITGPQPRYFLPVFLLLLLWAAIALGKVLQPRTGAGLPAMGWSAGRAERLTMWVAAALALFAVVLLFQSYYIGQWVPKGEGGWKMVNMYGWQVT